ncbi:PH domain-containing protein, partial [Dysosmobacter welbionis]
QPLHQGRDVRPIGLDKGIDVGGLRSREHRRQTAGGLCGCVCQLSGSVRPRGGLQKQQISPVCQGLGPEGEELILQLRHPLLGGGQLLR